MAEDADSGLELHSAFLRLSSNQLDEQREQERQRYQTPELPSSFEEFFLAKAVEDLQSMREDYENGIRSLKSLRPWHNQNGQKEQALAQLLAGHKQHMFLETYVRVALKKSLRVAVRYVKWLERDGVSVVDNLREVVARCEAVCGHVSAAAVGRPGRRQESAAVREFLASLDDEPLIEYDRLKEEEEMDDRHRDVVKTEDLDCLVIKCEEADLGGHTNGGWPTEDEMLLDENGVLSVVDNFAGDDTLSQIQNGDESVSGHAKAETKFTLRSTLGLENGLNDEALNDKSRAKRHECTYCGKTFLKKSHYVVHIRIHTKEKPFSCSICKKSFNCKGSLAQHKAIHSDQRHPCMVCDMTLKTRQQLVKHMWRVHQLKIKQEDLKNEECASCGKRFYTKEDLKAHEIGHADGFKCHHCSKAFKMHRFLEQHLKSHHGEGKSGDDEDDEDDVEPTQQAKQGDDVANERLSGATTNVRHEDSNSNMLSRREQPRKAGAGSSSSSLSDDDDSHVNHDIDLNQNDEGHQGGFTGKTAEVKEVTDKENMLTNGNEEDDGPFTCFKCDKLCNTRSELAAHKKSHAEAKRSLFQCRICGKMLSSKFSLKDHYSLHANIECTVCGKSFHSRQTLGRHLREAHEMEPPLWEDDVGVDHQSNILASIDEFKDGTDGEFGGSKKRAPRRKKRYDCEFCGKALSQKWKYTEHIKTHTGEKPFKCDICSRQFAAKGNLKDHYETHTDVTYPCTQCGKRFNTRVQMRRHMRDRCSNMDFDAAVGTASAAGGDETPETCDHCGRTYKSRKQLEWHMRIHTQDKHFTCEECGKAFHSNFSLNSHKKRVHNVDVVKVESGEPGDAARNNAAAGANKIGGMKRERASYMCSDCGKCFSHKTKLTYHMNIHTGAKPFKCTVCPKSFSSATNLFIHKDVHTDEKFPCEYCGKMLNTRSCLYRHRLKQHKDKKVVKAPSKVETN